MGNILFIIVVVVAVIAVLIYRKSQGANANLHAEQTKHIEETKNTARTATSKPQAAAEPAPAASKPVEKPVAAKAIKEEYAPVEPHMPEALAEQVNALANEKTPLARHRLLSQLTEATYKKRKDAQYRAACDYFSALHINEFDKIKAPLKKSNGGKLPQVMTFQNYANLLLEDERYDDAVKVCEKAIKFGLDDKTQTGFNGRIERIQAKQKKA